MVSVTMPELGEGVVEATVARWLKREGEPVAKAEPLVEVITDKVNSEVPAPEAGTVRRIAVPAGKTVRVGTEIAVIEAAESAVPAPAEPAHGEREQPRTSPLVRRLAREHDVDLTQVTGTGNGGRVRKEDMLAYLESREASEGPPRAPEPEAPQAAPAGEDEELLPLTPMRRAIAEHMVRSVTTAPHAWTYVEVDVDGLVRLRDGSRAAFREREGFDLTYVPFVAKATVETLREHPILNSTWRDGQVALKRHIHLGVAVALEDGLVVPVLRDADGMSVAGIARALHGLVGRAREGRLRPDDVQGGTFTLNNTGALGSVLSMPIINQPQAAILTMEAIRRQVVALPGDAIAVRPQLNLCLSFDHRVCDGLPVGRFLQALKGRLEATSPGDPLY